MRFVIPGLLIFLATGCHDSHGSGVNGTPSFPFTLSISPSGLNIPAGGWGCAMVTAVRESGFTEDITFSLEGAPEGVVGSGTVASNTQAGQLSLFVASGVAPQDLKDLQVKGTAGSLSRTAPFHLVVAAPLPPGMISPDQVQASGGIQKGGLLENEGVAMEPVTGDVSRNTSAEIRHGFDPSTP